MSQPSNNWAGFLGETVARGLGALVAAVGVAVLAGWIFDITALKTIAPNWVSMKANTALAFVLSGLSLWLSAQNSAGPRSLLIARACSVLAALIGLATLSQYLFGWELGIDQFLFEDAPRALGTSAPGRMAPNTALSFALLGVSLLLLDFETRRGRRPSQFLALAAILVSSFALIGYIYAFEPFYGVANYTRMALHTAVTFIVLSLGILAARPERGIVAAAIRVESRLTTRLTTLVILVVLLSGVLVSAVLVQQRKTTLRDRIMTTNLTTVGLVAEFASRYMEAARSSLSVLATNPDIVEAVLNGNFGRITPALQSALKANTRLDGCSIFDLNGINRATCNISSTGLDSYSGDRDWSQQALATGKPYLGFPVVSRGTGRPVVSYAVPIFDRHGAVRAVVVGGISLAQLSDAITSLQTGPSSRVSLNDTRQGGMILAHVDRRRILQPLSGPIETVNRLLKGERDSMETADIQGNPTLAAFAPVRDLPWGVLILQPSAAAFAPVEAAARQNLLLIAVLLAACTFITSWLAKRLTRPIATMRDAANALAAGDLSRRLNFTRQDEIGELGRSFDTMASALAQRNEQLKSANRELESFSYSVSHDLRAPLRQITGFGELLKKNAGERLDPQDRHHLDMILDSSREMAALIDDLLEFSRMGRAEQRVEKVDLNGLVREAIGQLIAETQGRSIDWRIEPLPEVQGDGRTLRLALVNLLSNALKFTRTRAVAVIVVGSTPVNGATVIYVRDNGVGFDMRYVDKLFGVFQRLHRSEDFEGTGIGLANVRRIVSRHGGLTWAEGAVDQGTTFYFSLPG